jgi:copper transport protein
MLFPRLTRFRGLALVLGLTALLASPAVPASGHAYLDMSQPEAGDIVEEPPEEVRLWFTEPLEPDHSFALLYDATGDQVETEESRISRDDRFQMALPLPDDLPNGTYTVQWRNISAADGHPQSGFFAFTIGTADDVTVPGAPPEDATTGDPGILEPISRWLSFVGVTLAVGTVFAWLWVIRPSLLETGDGVLPAARQNARRLALAGLALAIIGAILALIVQTIIVTRGLSFGDVQDTLLTTRFGGLWGLRMLQFGMLAVVLFSGALWRQRRVGRTGWLALAIALLALMPFSATSHAAAVTVGTTTAIVNDWLHFAASSVWIGGIMAMIGALIIATRELDGVERREVFAEAIPRFSTMAIASVLVLTLSGLYSSWLQVGNLYGLRETEYGQTLALKLILTVPLLALGAVNLLWIGPRMRSAAGSGRHFGRVLGAEAALGLAVLAIVAMLVSLPPARSTLENEAERTNFRFSQGDLDVALYITPGAVGQNRFTVDITSQGGELPEETGVQVRVGRELVLGGVRQIDLERSPESIGPRAVRYEATGGDLSVAGEWDLELLVLRPGEIDWRVERALDVPTVPAADRVPAPAPRFVGFQAVGIPIALALAIVFGTVALRNRLDEEADRVLGGLAAMLLIFSGLATWQTMVDTTPATQLRNPILLTPSSVETGRELYVEHCAVCHGPGGEGDGEQAPELARRPADLTGPHVDIHPDGDLYWWIQDGIDPAMPGFRGALSDNETWHLVNYIRHLRDPIDE